MVDEERKEELKKFIESADRSLDGDDRQFYDFVGEKLSFVSSICTQISTEEISQAHIYSVKSMLDILVSCVDMKMENIKVNEGDQ